MNTTIDMPNDVLGEFVSLNGERYYVIRDVDKMAPFFISLVSDSDHWLFIASNGGLTAGRISPETALLPYVTVDKIYDSTPHTGCKTLIRATADGQQQLWQPFNKEQDDRYIIRRNLYKNTLGNKLLFEEINIDLGLAFRYQWLTSDNYGFTRQGEIENIGSSNVTIELLDGIQNILPAGTPRFTQTNSSYLVDAYKYSELDQKSGLGMFTLFSAITDRAEPCESLNCSTVFCLGLPEPKVLLSSAQLDNFRRAENVTTETQKRGIRAAYWVNSTFDIAPQCSQHWQLVANVEQSQSDVVKLIQQLENPTKVENEIEKSVNCGSENLKRIMAAGDAFQLTREENVSVHHYANVQFNILRGGIFNNQYQLSSSDFCASIKHFNLPVYQRHQTIFNAFPEQQSYSHLLSNVTELEDPQLLRLCYEYLPITFGRRHGDPSRPWNQFAIQLKDAEGKPLLSYQGNWRDIFQNWEALLFSYPEYIENVIAKFVNASTIDGYNPYRITKQGIDWEVEEPDDPWSYIGYWGDHQIIYLQKLLELSQQFHPARLGQLLTQPIYSYANVPYKIKPFEAMLKNAKSTVYYDDEQALRIEQRVEKLGADGKLLLDANDNVYQVSLLEKLLVPLLSKLANLVVDGGIWLNTQRPEWNDANNALVGQGLSMVTLYYMRRYMVFVQQLLLTQTESVELSKEVSDWLMDTTTALTTVTQQLRDGPLDDLQRYSALQQLAQAASEYRQTVYQQEGFSGTVIQAMAPINTLLQDALLVVDHSIHNNKRSDGLYHAYNLLAFTPKSASVDNLYLMLEGQVAVLSSGAITPDDAIHVVEELYNSSLFRPDQNSFLLYPDRELSSYLHKNCLPAEQVEELPLLMQMISDGDQRLIEQDDTGNYRFNTELTNIDALNSRLVQLTANYGEALTSVRQPLQALYEQVFNHKAFTGRSGGMFGFEGLGSIYWHMVSKLLLAVQENFFNAQRDVDRLQLARLYYRVRDGIGFNKTPTEYGAFPTDPYSHTPKHIGAQQPGMTGQVKEEIITRFAELGVRVSDGAINFDPSLLRCGEFLSAPLPFRFIDVAGEWQELSVPANGLAFSWCQLPLLYQLDDTAEPAIIINWKNGESQTLDTLTLPAEIARHVFERNNQIRQLTLLLPRKKLSEL